MKRFLLFGYVAYYPCGGSGDVIDSFDTIEEAKDAIKSGTPEYSREYFELLDMDKREWIQIQESAPNAV